MRVQTDRDITGETAKMLRERTSLPQREFWRKAGASQAAGCRYESGKRSIPPSVRSLLFINFVAGIEIDTATLEGARKVRALAAKR